MGSMSKQKGKRGEKEVLKWINLFLYQLGDKMILEHMNALGADIALQGMAIEVKRREKLEVKKWWDQTKLQASQQQEINGDGKWVVPVLWYRRNLQKWSIMYDAGDGVITTSTEGFRSFFMQWYKEVYKNV